MYYKAPIFATSEKFDCFEKEYLDVYCRNISEKWYKSNVDSQSFQNTLNPQTI